MKHLALTIFAILLSVSAAHAKTENYVLGTNPNEFAGLNHCAPRVHLTIAQNDDGRLMATLENYIEGGCNHAVPANKRTYVLIENDRACGSRQFNGVTKDSYGIETQIKILDHSTRVCRDIVPSQLVVTETRGEEAVKMYALDQLPQVTCQAYWTGYVIDPVSKNCLPTSATSCRNPFRYQTESQCRAAAQSNDPSVSQF